MANIPSAFAGIYILLSYQQILFMCLFGNDSTCNTRSRSVHDLLLIRLIDFVKRHCTFTRISISLFFDGLRAGEKCISRLWAKCKS